MSQQRPKWPHKHRPQYDSFFRQLAGRPGLVVILTAAYAIVATGVVLWIEPGADAFTLISMLATMWALVLSLLIYLLTARDTDNVLDQINDLKAALAAALSEPDEAADDAAEVEAEPAPLPQAQIESPPPVPVPAPTTTPAPTGQGPQTAPTPGRQDDRDTIGQLRRELGHGARGTMLSKEDLPTEYVAAWERETGYPASDIYKAWARSGQVEGPWVVVSATHRAKWAIFERADGGAGPVVITLGRGDPRERPNAAQMQARNQARAQAKDQARSRN